jgi:peptidyl-prolyl cis-trans isomerase A (cyclophilin A)
MGNITDEIYLDKMPVTAGNFLKLIDDGVYNKGTTMFYRTVRLDNQLHNKVKIEVIQGGLNDHEPLKPVPAPRVWNK